MSAKLIRQLFEVALSAISPALATAFENVDYQPISGTPYQKVNTLFAKPANPELTGTFYIEQGYFQVTLRYPFGVGSGACSDRAELIRTTFYFGKTFTGLNTILTIVGTPTISQGMIDGDRWSVPVKIPFTANCNR